MFLFNSTFYLQGKNPVYLTAFLHFVLIGFGIWSLVIEMLNYQEPVTNYEAIYIGLHYIVHVLLLFSLIIGTWIDLPFFLLPWLAVSFITFFIVTVLTLISLKDIEFYNILTCLLNFLCLGAYWFSWYTVFLYFINEYKKEAKIIKNTCYDHIIKTMD